MVRSLLVLMLLTAPALAAEQVAPEAPKVPLATARANARGNALLSEGEFEAAAKIYREEALRRPENGVLQRNLAGALARSDQMEEGLAAYGQALRFAETNADKAAALYDLGNTMALGGQLEPALQTYVSAMMLAPEDMDIRHNYEFVLDQLQQQQEQEQQQEEKEGEDEGEQEGEQQPQPDPEQQGDEEKPEDDSEQQQEQQNPENPEEQQEPQPAAPEDGEAMDPEDAKRLLDAMLEEEKELQAERNKQMQPRNPNVEKDW
jgi:Ca-activated chloride channel homolog